MAVASFPFHFRPPTTCPGNKATSSATFAGVPSFLGHFIAPPTWPGNVQFLAHFPRFCNCRIVSTNQLTECFMTSCFCELHLHCRRNSLSFVLHGAMMSEDWIKWSRRNAKLRNFYSWRTKLGALGGKFVRLLAVQCHYLMQMHIQFCDS